MPNKINFPTVKLALENYDWNTHIATSPHVLEKYIFRRPPGTSVVWFYLLNKMEVKDTESLKAGQLYTSIEELREHLSYSEDGKKVVPTKSSVSGIVRRFRRNGLIKTEIVNHEGMMKITFLQV